MSSAEDLGGSALVEALDYVAAGYKVGPVTVRLVDGKKRALFHTRWSDPAGISGDPEQVATWAREHPGCGFHAPTEPNGIVVVDGDVKTDAEGRTVADGVSSWRRAKGPDSTMVVSTRSGGRHWYFRAPEDPIGNSANAISGVPDVDVRGTRLGDKGQAGTVFISGTVVQGGGGHYAANRIVPPSSLPALPEQWAERLRRAGPRGEKSRTPERRERTATSSRLVGGGAVHDAAWIEAKVDDELRELARRGQGDFRARLFATAAIVYRGVEAGVLEEAEADDRLRDAIVRVWGAEPDRDDRQWLAEARSTAAGDPWRVAAGPGPLEAVETDDDGPMAETPVDLERGLAAPRDLEPPDLGDAPDDDQRDGGVDDEELDDAARWQQRLDLAMSDERLRREARRRLDAEDVAPLRLLSFGEFIASPRPEPIVPGVFYRDSLARIYGAPGCGKSFLAMDLACHVALGRDWRDEEVVQGSVVYVMAEGQAVNVERVEAWCERNKVDPAGLEGSFYAVPDAVALTEHGVGDLVAAVRDLQPVLVILDTKNAMMVGEENSATDTAVMRRALDGLRKASDACVVLIDHTGHEGTRARGSSAATAAMDTEVRVAKTTDSPALVTAEITRDKAREAGRSWRWHLRMAANAAALAPTELEDDAPVDGDLEWTTTEAVVPTELLHFEGAGARAMPDLARYMASEASSREGDPGEIGVSRADAERSLAKRGHAKSTVRRAWSALIDRGQIEPAQGVKAPSGRHLWHP